MVAVGNEMKKTEEESSLITELTTKGYFDRARERARRRKSPWNLILIPLGFFSVFCIAIVFFNLLWQLHIQIYPEDIGKLKELLRNDRPRLPQLLMTLPCFIAAIPSGFIFANCLAWLIPPARRAFDHESEGVAHASLRAAMTDLGKIGLGIILVCSVLGIIGAYTLR